MVLDHVVSIRERLGLESPIESKEDTLLLVLAAIA